MTAEFRMLLMTIRAALIMATRAIEKYIENCDTMQK